MSTKTGKASIKTESESEAFAAKIQICWQDDIVAIQGFKKEWDRVLSKLSLYPSPNVANI
ncbi:hypothetical protein CCACVL1_28608 [Corchorus capsularis]|uniref:Uncharacterized protein n=1 Tax=Corchorus capsularis TaxID=210143 RepID=A0A1R3G633_COCAP|nr:hypothetical protein CCACVL1_28608 [Corchorus capsularis]